MECIENQRTLGDYASGDTSPELCKEIEAHLTHCYVCREELSQHEALLRACRTALRHPLPLDRWDELSARMDQQVSREFPGWQRMVRRRVLAGMLAAAAMLVLVLRSAFAPAPPSNRIESPEEGVSAPAPLSLAPDGLISVASSSRDTTPLVRYRDTVTYYIHTLTLDASKQPQPEATDTALPQESSNTFGPSIRLLTTSHTYA